MTISSADIQNAFFLSDVAYEHGSDSLTQQLNGSYWSSVGGYATDSSGYYSQGNAQGFAAISGDGRTLAIAFRGSELTDPGPDDFREAVYTQDDHYLDFSAFISAIHSYLDTHSNIQNILVTGHSLGGAMAELKSEERRVGKEC